MPTDNVVHEEVEGVGLTNLSRVYWAICQLEGAYE